MGALEKRGIVFSLLSSFEAPIFFPVYLPVAACFTQ